ncbi:MAG: molybdopterin oxidoreductase [Firmicutes bacterium HGW-Firmicutes-16]|nr:MAG: molybdopterin oxidoreductase [Firmicutes bacterium HGW-Firmicutes-16]
MKELVCIVCPNGCVMTVNSDGQSITVTGNKCPKGEQFAYAEETNPTRTICSTVKTAFPYAPVLPVRVSAEIPKNRIFDVMCEINKVVLRQPIACGDAVITNVLSLGVDIIATSNILKQSS